MISTDLMYPYGQWKFIEQTFVRTQIANPTHRPPIFENSERTIEWTVSVVRMATFLSLAGISGCFKHITWSGS